MGSKVVEEGEGGRTGGILSTAKVLRSLEGTTVICRRLRFENGNRDERRIEERLGGLALTLGFSALNDRWPVV